MKRNKLFFFAAACGLALTGCSEDSDQGGGTDTEAATTGSTGAGTTGDGETTMTPAGSTTTDTPETTTDDESSGGESSSSTGELAEHPVAEVVVDGIEPLAGGFHFELWGIIDEAPVTIGKFNVDASGAIVDLEGIAIPDAQFDAGRDLLDATDFVITIETEGDVDITPGVSKYLAGPRDGVDGELVIADPSALGDDFSSADGQFILATPTDGPDSSEYAGVWFLDLGTNPPTPGLELPDLPEGWEYEGWAVVDGTPISTGRFTSVDMADLAAPHSGPSPGPMVPGEDLLLNAPEGLTFPADLRGQRIVVSIEPEPDDSERPFTLKPLIADVAENAAAAQSMPIENAIESLPTATVRLLE